MVWARSVPQPEERIKWRLSSGSVLCHVDEIAGRGLVSPGHKWMVIFWHRGALFRFGNMVFGRGGLLSTTTSSSKQCNVVILQCCSQPHLSTTLLDTTIQHPGNPPTPTLSPF